VALFGVSVWAYAQEHEATKTECLNGKAEYGCVGGTTPWSGPQRTRIVNVNPQAGLARWSRYAAGATLVVTLAALRMLGLRRPSRDRMRAAA